MNIVLTNDALTIAGGENFILYLATELRKREHDVAIAPLACSALHARSRELGFSTYGIAYGTHGKEFGAYAALVRACRGRGVDVMHSNSYIDRSIAAFAGLRLGCVNIASVHSCLSIRRNALHWFRNAALVDQFVPDGHSTRRVLIDQDRIPAERITVIHNGIPEEVVRTDAGLRARLRSEFAIPDDIPVLGAIGTMIPFKGHACLLDAVAQLRGARTDFRCVIVGNGPSEESLRAQVSALGLDELVLLPGHRTDLDALYSLFDVFVMPSLDNGGETFPLVMVYALAAGLPVIGSDVGDIAYMVDGSNGMLIPPGDPTALSGAIARLLAEARLRTSMGARSRALYEERFTIGAMTDQFVALYERLLAKRGSG
jgi:glycosyltransferase involved in cell wall biosynthesis